MSRNVWEQKQAENNKKEKFDFVCKSDNFCINNSFCGNNDLNVIIFDVRLLFFYLWPLFSILKMFALNF